ncbi:D-alanyl-D-alanine carboxypeptidase family protein [Clostridium fallax]|uniref:D-alanyl-D-alanine carboxypeptidase n=1 Tax=Clostridium fallax TaxID=1533 RepID=A0A1M4XZK4_9CLOT|nr:D-alanyl-D-alanine carboxypeptidase family protein [Clostridium fallax]SHE98733.1 D-alanyl-D-alanine carboxypeptidase [Clostridium fallax]SQB06491.1 D-alanyl-D-alanine carboxypeptidase [Clostridium fallax]
MKKIISILILIFFICINSTKVLAKDLVYDAKYVLALDGDSKQILFEKNGHNIVPMASTTKILTSYIALNCTDLNENFKVSKNAQYVRGSKVGLKADENITSEELTYGLMFKSGNDAAVALAEGIAYSEENFADLMNHFSHSMGFIDSNFETVHGLDSQNHYTTCYDLAMLTAKAMENETFSKIVSSKEITKEGFNRSYNNINKILWRIPEANGVKTGYTGQAGKCLVTSVNYGGRNIIIVVLNSEKRWEVTERVFNYLKENYDFNTVDLKDLNIKKLEGNLRFSIPKNHTYKVEALEKSIFKSKEKIKEVKVIDTTDNSEILKKYY